MRTIEEITQAIISHDDRLLAELANEARAAGIQDTKEFTNEFKHHHAVRQIDAALERCALSHAEATALVRYWIGNTLGLTPEAANAVYETIAADQSWLAAVTRAAALGVVSLNDVDRGNILKDRCLAALLDEEAVSNPAKLWRLVKEALDAAHGQSTHD